MDERTKILISLGAATAANCVPCFEHYFEKADAVGLTSVEIQEAADIGDKVKKGAQMAMRRSIGDVIGQGLEPCTRASDRPCCG